MQQIWLSPALLGVLNHIFFRYFEPGNAHYPLLAILIQPALLLSFLSHGTPTVPTALNVLGVYATFIGSLSLSIVLYRLSPWHPLASVPGPTLYKISKVWSIRDAVRGDPHRVVRRMHDKYGPVVRTGPNEVSIVHTDAVKVVLGTYPKGQHYEPRDDPAVPAKSLLVLKGEAHANRRRIWNRGLNSASIAAYEVTLVKRVAQLLERLEEQSLSGSSVSISKWLGYFTFDFMGDMAFGGGFEMMRDRGDTNGLWKIIEDGTRVSALLAPIPWIVPTVRMLPGLAKNMNTLSQFGVDSAANRIQAGSLVKDLWYHLTDEAEVEKQRPSIPEVVADGVLSIIAGSDTTSTALSNLIWLLLSNPAVYKQVREEVDSVYPRGDSPLDASKHSQLSFLTACINETLRLLPPVPSGGPRKVPVGGGKVIAGHYIAPNTQIFVPQYTLHRSAENFDDPDTFKPQRWLSPESAEKHNPLAFIPFSFGSANCVGKNLAWREMIMVSAALIHTFDIRFAKDFAGAEEWSNHLHDQFVTNIAMPLQVTLTKRD
ncbi:unnamed protein product [Mycena citricolor]|uniref:Cytochrome P450 n=1 Tax=Mycena citricolor TaxID=2018698 RepID=A0AAD2K3W1_9AGAR|nr:unnamed protein product [Mycena citricolor]